MNVHTYVGEIRMFAGEHPPEGWVFCDGRLLSSGDYHALYALIYDSFGGDHEHFAVPDLRGRVPIHMGTQPGKVQIQLAHKGGAEKVVLTDQHVPPHNHTVYGVTDEAKQAKPSVKFMATPKTLVYAPAVTEDQKVPMKAGSIAKSGTPGYAISTVQPYQAINFIIALDGEFPPRD